MAPLGRKGRRKRLISTAAKLISSFGLAEPEHFTGELSRFLTELAVCLRKWYLSLDDINEIFAPLASLPDDRRAQLAAEFVRFLRRIETPQATYAVQILAMQVVVHGRGEAIRLSETGYKGNWYEYLNLAVEMTEFLPSPWHVFERAQCQYVAGIISWRLGGVSEASERLNMALRTLSEAEREAGKDMLRDWNYRDAESFYSDASALRRSWTMQLKDLNSKASG